MSAQHYIAPVRYKHTPPESHTVQIHFTAEGVDGGLRSGRETSDCNLYMAMNTLSLYFEENYFTVGNGCDTTVYPGIARFACFCW